MLNLILWSSVFVISLFVLVKASSYFTDSSEELGLYFGMPAFLVGVTIVAIGTSLPELVSSIISVIQNSSEFVAGNVIGSNIANIFLILGISAIVAKKLTVTYELVSIDLPLLVGSSFIFAFTIYDGVFTLGEAIICLFGELLYILYVISTQKKRKVAEKKFEKEIKEEMRKEKRAFTIKDIGILFCSAIFIYIGAKYTVDSVIRLSEIFNIGKDIIAISAVAIGTSLPELTVSINAVLKGKPEIALGNVLGSNIFNVFAVMGVARLFGNISISSNAIYFGLPIMIAATILYFFVTQDKKITLWEGWMFVILYILFIAKILSIF